MAAGLLLVVVMGIGCVGCNEPAEVERTAVHGSPLDRRGADEMAEMWSGAKLPVESDYVYVPREGDGEADGITTFSILGAVINPGLYERIRPGMRLLDAIALARGVTEPVKYAYVIRPVARPAGGESSDEEPVEDTRIIAVDMRELFHGDPRMNVLIGPDDFILVPGKVLGKL